MAQVTFYLDDELATVLRHVVQTENISQSRWIADLIRQTLRDEWTADVVALAGAWADFPALEDIRSNSVNDVAREPL